MIKVITKEILVCCSNGIILSTIATALSMILQIDLKLSLIFGAAIIINFTLAGFCGSVIPVTLNKFDIDPATASGVFLTALTDSLGFFTFLFLAKVFLT